MATNGIILFLFMAEEHSVVYIRVCIHVCITSSLSIHLLGCFHVLAIVNNTAVNVGMFVSFRTVFVSRYMPRSGISG